MSKEKVLKIRDSLKAIYDLYEEVYDLFFTTYNYEPDFFDEYIVAYLMGFDRKITTIGELKDADEWIQYARYPKIKIVRIEGELILSK